MLNKYREKRALEKNKDVVELVLWNETTLENLDKKLAGIETLPDAAEKILSLKAFLNKDVDEAISSGRNKRLAVLKKREHSKPAYAGAIGTGGIAAGVAIAVTASTVFPPAAIVIGPAVILGMFGPGKTLEHHEEKKKKRVRSKNPGIDAFDGETEALKTEARDLLAETENNCDLNVISRSPYFDRAFNVSYKLSQRFAAAGVDATKQGFEKKAAQEPALRKPASNVLRK